MHLKIKKVFIWYFNFYQLYCVRMIPISTHPTLTTADDKSAIEYLHAYGYLPLKDKYNLTEISEATSIFQRFNGVADTKIFDKATLNLMTKPRCGEKDITNQFLNGAKKKNIYNFTLTVAKWSNTIAQAIQKSAIVQSINQWGKTVPLKIQWVTKNAEIIFIFDKDISYHNPRKAGKAPVLSNIYKIGNIFYIYIDDKASSKNVILRRTINHVFGHIFGHFHENVQSIMSPILEAKYPILTMVPWMYSAATCKTSITAVFSHAQDGQTYMFQTDKFWRISNGYIVDSQYPKLISSTWYGIPNNFDEGFIWARNWNTYFFKGKYYYRYNNTIDRVDKGYPLLIKDGWNNVPDDIDAVFNDQKLDTYFFKDHLVYLYSNAKDMVETGYPKEISKVFPNVPNKIDSVFRYYFDNEVYFFKDFSFWKWNKILNRADGPYSINSKWRNLCAT